MRKTFWTGFELVSYLTIGRPNQSTTAYINMIDFGLLTKTLAITINISIIVPIVKVGRDG